jgi:hypothetical protein
MLTIIVMLSPHYDWGVELFQACRELYFMMNYIIAGFTQTDIGAGECRFMLIILSSSMSIASNIAYLRRTDRL